MDASIELDLAHHGNQFHSLLPLLHFRFGIFASFWALFLGYLDCSFCQSKECHILTGNWSTLATKVDGSMEFLLLGGQCLQSPVSLLLLLASYPTFAYHKGHYLLLVSGDFSMAMPSFPSLFFGFRALWSGIGVWWYQFWFMFLQLWYLRPQFSLCILIVPLPTCLTLFY